MVQKPVKRYSLSRQVADQLEKMIANGTYSIGDRIQTEPELAEMFGVSRNTVRESVKALAAEGILTVKQGDGTYVRANNRFHANMSMKYEQSPLKDILETRNALEIAIAHLASQRRTAADLKQLKTTLEARRQFSETKKENTMVDIRFHMAIAEACHNKILIDLYHSISAYLEDHIASRQANTTLDVASVDGLHDQLFQAIEDRNPDTARSCVQHILEI